VLLHKKYPRWLFSCCKKCTSFRVEEQPFLDFTMQGLSGSKERYFNNLSGLNVNEKYAIG